MLKKTKRIEDKKHPDWLRTLPCCISGVQGNTDPAHIRKGTDGGTGLKPSDCWAVPLHHAAHVNQHQYGEISFWKPYGGIDRAKKLAKDLYAVSGDDRAARKLLEDFR